MSALRDSHEELIAGDYKEIFPDSEEIFAFERSLDGKTITTVVNFSLEHVKIPDEISNKKIILMSEKDFDKSELKPLEARIYFE